MDKRTGMGNSLSDNLDKILQEKGWSRYRLSKESGVPASTIYNNFKKDAAVSFRTLCKLARRSWFIKVFNRAIINAKQAEVVSRQNPPDKYFS